MYGIYDDHHTYHEGEQKGVCLLLLFTFAYFRVSLHFFSLLFFFMKVDFDGYLSCLFMMIVTLIVYNNYFFMVVYHDCLL